MTKLKTHLSRQVSLPVWSIYYGFAWFAFFCWLFSHVNQWISSLVLIAVWLAHPFALAAIDNRRARHERLSAKC